MKTIMRHIHHQMRADTAKLSHQRRSFLRTLLATGLTICTATAMADEDVIQPSKFTAAGHTMDKLNVVKQRVEKKKALLLDVREKSEWTAGHLKQAKFVPMSAVRADTLTPEMKKLLTKDKPIYVHCASGGRVLTVSKILKAKGYDIRPLKDGYTNLLKAGFEKAKPTKK